MADVTRRQLEQAYALIQEDRLDDAISLLKGIIARQPDHEDAWWLMANAVSEPEDAYNALSNVLRINPDHTEAREAFEQLMAEYPELGKPTAPADLGDDLSVDIDELLAKTTGVLDPNAQVSPMLRKPPTDKDVSSFYLDQAWASRDQEQPAAQGAGARSAADLDLDELFDTSTTDVPVTPTEVQDLEAVFDGVTPGSRRSPPASQQAQAKPPVQPVSAEETRTTHSSDLDDIFEKPFDQPAPVPAAASARDTFDTDLGDIFGPPPDKDAEPSFVPTIEASPPAKEQGRRRRKQEPEPQVETVPNFEESAGAAEQPAETGRRRRRERVPRPQVIEPEPPPRDPFEMEHKANRRRILPRLAIVALLLVALAGGAFLLLPRVTAPDAVGQAVQKINDELVARGFSEVTATRSDGAIQVRLCSTAGRALQGRIFEAMDLIAAQVGGLGEAIQTAQIEVVTCGKPDVRLFRAAAPMDAIVRYVESGQANKREYRASWQRN